MRRRQPLVSPARDWKIMVRVAVMLGITAAISAAALFFAIDSEFLLKSDGSAIIEVERVDRDGIQAVISQFNAREREFKSLLLAPPVITNPSL
ncbi:MAG: hypothetical protein COW88_03255 [Candidatus Lloydbacteria bacterium CG22_combo_CG10-13_8_21_14_all_47_15]|uniref:Uncharacterized protein n=1 Tax=Candidatus Lloydbacteria bacterium CG22_combo_CG10-13_8_21_14_all_47_15 TaxID=1974635 RepID=A0A2H0CTN8_9BACT|nr:MAG: hypothetical protein COW88_03255 [Candidatus Lloydbacteria bacterium CG22_combo_CG10-13_8_21_14_all_47_15]